jgi:Uma2 family endonuclease
MPTTTTPAEEHQTHWQQIVTDPSLQDLPYTVETNHRGQLVLSPHKNWHSFRQEAIGDLLEEHAPEGATPPEFAIATPKGVKAPDIVWISADRRQEMKKTGDPTTLAPELCIEVMSEANDWDEMMEKRALYREAGAEEVWIVTREGRVRFFGDGEREASRIAPDFPDEI